METEITHIKNQIKKLEDIIRIAGTVDFLYNYTGLIIDAAYKGIDAANEQIKEIVYQDYLKKEGK